MTHHDITGLLAPVSDEQPAGENLEYDPAFTELERVATPKGERSIGDAVKAAEEPDWSRVSSLATALLTRSKDLRAAIHLAAAWTRADALAGWAAGMELVRHLLETYWEGVHPQLDAEDDNDPTSRVNALLALTDPQGPLGFFRLATFVQSPRLGRFSLRDLKFALGLSHAAEGEASASLVDIEACCMDCAEDDLRAALVAIVAAAEHAQAIDALLIERLGVDSPDLKPLLADIHELRRFVESQHLRRFPDEVVQPEPGQADVSPAAATATTTPVAGIHGPRDVLNAIDEICAYYQRSEPSSPVPILLRRARGLVGMNFLDLLKNLAPGGISELEVISGPQDNE